MIKLTNEKILNQAFSMAVRKLCSCQLSGKTAKSLGKTISILDFHRKNIASEWDTKMKEWKEKYGERDENGNFKINPQDPSGFNVPEEKVEEFTKEREDFLSIVVEIDRNQIAFDAVEKFSFSASEMILLESFFVEAD